jgi:hypothetical protein
MSFCKTGSKKFFYLLPIQFNIPFCKCYLKTRPSWAGFKTAEEGRAKIMLICIVKVIGGWGVCVCKSDSKDCFHSQKYIKSSQYQYYSQFFIFFDLSIILILLTFISRKKDSIRAT